MDQRAVIEIVTKYTTFLKNKGYMIEKVYLFGSYAKGHYSEDSDIDLAIAINNLSNSFIMQIQLMKLSRKFDSRIEPHPFDDTDFNSSNPFANEILKTGIKIL